MTFGLGESILDQGEDASIKSANGIENCVKSAKSVETEEEEAKKEREVQKAEKTDDPSDA